MKWQLVPRYFNNFLAYRRKCTNCATRARESAAGRAGNSPFEAIHLRRIRSGIRSTCVLMNRDSPRIIRVCFNSAEMAAADLLVTREWNRRFHLTLNGSNESLFVRRISATTGRTKDLRVELRRNFGGERRQN